MRTALATRASREHWQPWEMLASGSWGSRGTGRPPRQLTGSSGSGLKVWSAFQFGLSEERGNGRLLADTWSSPLGSQTESFCGRILPLEKGREEGGGRKNSLEQLLMARGS